MPLHTPERFLFCPVKFTISIMLQYRFRFHGHGSLRYLYQHGHSVRSRTVSVRFVANPKRVHSRAAVVITRKVLKSAPKRNRVRRRVFEILRTNWGHIKPANDIVLTIFDPRAADMPHDELLTAVVDVLKRAHLWQTESQDHKSDSSEV